MLTDAVSHKHYLVITPCRNEAEFARRTLDSVTAQTVLPVRWVIVDDGSTDATPQILAEYAAKYEFITVIRRPDRGKRAVGPGVIEAFYAGLECIDIKDYDYICKLDLDLELPAGYFEGLLRRMVAEPRIGTCSGKPYYRDSESDQLISENIGDEMSVGAAKFYDRQCFEQIGGFVRQVMWDGIDCHRCRMLGWIAVSWDDPALRFIHLRPMGSSQQGIWAGRVRHGFGQYFMGTGVSYILVSAMYRLPRPPLIIGSLAILWGYFSSMLKRAPRYDDMGFRQFLRRYQRDCLISGKAKATQRLLNQPKPYG